jgi:hypothetical protein
MPVEAPALPVTERTTVPVSAIFDAAELKMPENPTPAAGASDSPLPITAPEPDAAAKAAADKTAADPDKTAADKVAADKVAADKVAADKVAADAAAKAAAPEEKIKVGGKEFTKAELEKALADRAAAPAPAAPAPTAVVPAPKPPTPEEIATQEAAWCEKFVTDEKLSVPISEKEMETILAGDKDGVTLLQSKLNNVVAKAVMLARKSIYNELNPVIGSLQSNLSPVLQNAQQVEAAAAEHQFFTAYPDFKVHAETVRRVGTALFERFPQELAKMTREQILAEVAAQSDRIIQAECERYNPGKNWRQLQAAPAADPAKAAADKAAADAAATKAAADAAAAKAAAPTSTIKPPGANSPAATGTSGAADPSWHKKTASSLAN